MAKEKVKKSDIKLVRELVDDLVGLVGVEADIEVTGDEDNEAVLVDIQSENESGLLIGKKGDTINSIQKILAMMVKQKKDKWIRIIVNVADWRKKQTERIKDLADRAVERAVESGQSQALYNLNSQERRVIHLHLSDSEQVETESLGEGRERYLIIKPVSD